MRHVSNLDNQCDCPPAVPLLTGEAKRAPGSFRVFGKQRGMGMPGNLTATGIGLFARCEQLVPGVQAVGAIAPRITQAMQLPADPRIDGKLVGLKFFVPRLKKIWADSTYRGQELAAWCPATGEWELEVVEHEAGHQRLQRGTTQMSSRANIHWLSCNRRISKDYERKIQTSETLIQWLCFGCSSLVWRGIYEPVPNHPIRT